MRGLLCLFAVAILCVHANYNTSLAMSALYYAKASYCDASSIAPWSCTACAYHPGFQVKNVYRNSTFDCQAFSGYSSSGTIVVSFRGSSNLPNWIADLDFFLVPYGNPACVGCQVHQGFYAYYLEMAKAIHQDVQSLLNQYPGSPILVTGHSLGAATSVHCALDIKTKLSGVTDLQVYNFGEPRVGNPAFAKWATTILPAGKQFRVTHAQDPVPHLPLIDMGFLHAPHELWYDNDGDVSWTDCRDNATSEDPNCSDGTLDIDVFDHLQYLGVHVGCGDSDLAIKYAKWSYIPPKWVAAKKPGSTKKRG